MHADDNPDVLKEHQDRNSQKIVLRKLLE